MENQHSGMQKSLFFSFLSTTFKEVKSQMETLHLFSFLKLDMHTQFEAKVWILGSSPLVWKQQTVLWEKKKSWREFGEWYLKGQGVTNITSV